MTTTIATTSIVPIHTNIAHRGKNMAGQTLRITLAIEAIFLSCLYMN